MVTAGVEGHVPVPVGVSLHDGAIVCTCGWYEYDRSDDEDVSRLLASAWHRHVAEVEAEAAERERREAEAKRVANEDEARSWRQDSPVTEPVRWADDFRVRADRPDPPDPWMVPTRTPPPWTFDEVAVEPVPPPPDAMRAPIRPQPAPAEPPQPGVPTMNLLERDEAWARRFWRDFRRAVRYR